MDMQMINCLTIIPARGGSKGIPRKNIRLMNGIPLIVYAIRNALSLCNYVNNTVVVDTDDVEIASIAKQYGAFVSMRPKELAGDEVTLDPVIHHTVLACEMEYKNQYDIVITMQPTSPTLTGATILKALTEFVKNSYDTMISGVNDPHLSWTISDNKIIPEYKERKNRQYLPPNIRETGGFVITKRRYITENSRFGSDLSLFLVDSKESVDIDTMYDWILCENILKEKKILLRANGEEKLGMGHIYRVISLAYHMTGHQILFATDRNMKLGKERLEEINFPVKLIESDEEFYEVIQEYKPDIVINDILDTSIDYMTQLKSMVGRVVNFEDKGPGSLLADAVINALYEGVEAGNIFSGFKYFFIRDEFLAAKPKAFSEKVNKVVIMFGGSDPSDLTRRLYSILQKHSDIDKDIEFHFITGFGYKHKYEIFDDEKNKIYVHNDVKRVSELLSEADMAITSQGRTIFELACMGVPSIVIAQNEREMEHDFADFSNGFINIGLGEELEEETIAATLEWLIKAKSVRKQMHELLLSKDFKNGQERVIKLILGE